MKKAKTVWPGEGIEARMADAGKAIFHVRWAIGLPVERHRYGIWGGGNMSAKGCPLVRAFDEFGHVQPIDPSRLEMESIASTWDPWTSWSEGHTFSPPRRMDSLEAARLIRERPKSLDVQPTQLALFAVAS